MTSAENNRGTAASKASCPQASSVLAMRRKDKRADEFPSGLGAWKPTTADRLIVRDRGDMRN